jgi:LacI family transcriptional regulator
MPITQKDIALKLGISRRLVGYALKGHSRVSPQTRQQVYEAAEQLGYQPNRAAQALTTGKTYQIALCFPLLGGTFYSEIIRRVEELTRRTSYDLLVTTFDPYNPKQCTKQFAVDAMLFVGPAFLAPAPANYPVVVIETQMNRMPSMEQSLCDRVEMEIQTACTAAMQHLIQQKFHRIAYVATSHMMQEEEMRFYIYRQEMERAGLTSEMITLPIIGETRIRQQSHQILQKYFLEKGFPDALFCSNDDEAIGAYRALRQLGRSIPHQTAILGFDDFDDAEFLLPPLTSVHLPVEIACERAFEMLLARTENAQSAPRYETYSAELKIRESTRREITDSDKSTSKGA